MALIESSYATLQFFIPYILPLVDYIRPRMYHLDETKITDGRPDEKRTSREEKQQIDSLFYNIQQRRNCKQEFDE